DSSAVVASVPSWSSEHTVLSPQAKIVTSLRPGRCHGAVSGVVVVPALSSLYCLMVYPVWSGPATYRSPEDSIAALESAVTTSLPCRLGTDSLHRYTRVTPSPPTPVTYCSE